MAAPERCSWWLSRGSPSSLPIWFHHQGRPWAPRQARTPPWRAERLAPGNRFRLILLLLPVPLSVHFFGTAFSQGFRQSPGLRGLWLSTFNRVGRCKGRKKEDGSGGKWVRLRASSASLLRGCELAPPARTLPVCLPLPETGLALLVKMQSGDRGRTNGAQSNSPSEPDPQQP